MKIFNQILRQVLESPEDRELMEAVNRKEEPTGSSFFIIQD